MHCRKFRLLLRPRVRFEPRLPLYAQSTWLRSPLAGSYGNARSDCLRAFNAETSRSAQMGEALRHPTRFPEKVGRRITQKSEVVAPGMGYKFWWKKSALFSGQTVSSIGWFALNQNSFIVIGALNAPGS